ncbi:TetR family transcriptional regulator [Rhizobium sp. RU36D]|uniref:TetR family transcriptional regulator n=1 Tax=Rhizobium sp. RU36D TaxID=1907415 RepID=UPI0009D88958|nr:TetR family transcriptional regulator [Rhizobium sp. RU36D]SMD16787.1 transcriptional regulator, TetR family [Rhizobium sp. RU36D]
MNGARKAERIQLRKKPQQERSIQRLDAILAAAAELIATKGISSLKMIDIAAKAGLPIGSLYQFFPEKAAVIRALHDRHTAIVEDGAIRYFLDLSSLDDAEQRLQSAVDQFYDFYRSEPTYLPIWLAAISDPDLQSLNQRHIDRLSVILCDVFRPLLPKDAGIDLDARVRLFVYLSGSIVRFALIQDEKTAQRVLTEWKTNIRKTLFTP